LIYKDKIELGICLKLCALVDEVRTSIAEPILDRQRFRWTGNASFL